MCSTESKARHDSIMTGFVYVIFIICLAYVTTEVYRCIRILSPFKVRFTFSVIMLNNNRRLLDELNLTLYSAAYSSHMLNTRLAAPREGDTRATSLVKHAPSSTEGG